MEQTKEYNQITQFYLELTKGEPSATIGPPYSLYHADTSKTDIIIKNVINVDIKSAFPTACRLIFGINHPFVQKIFQKTDKKDRNIFIATTLTELRKSSGINYINEITLISKELIFCYAFSKYDNVHILEYAKDGMIIYANDQNNPTQPQYDFLSFCKSNDIIFHDDVIDSYMRFNKTSIFQTGNNVIVKGKYHGIPNCIKDIVNKFFNGAIYNETLLNTIKKYYSRDFFNILLHGHVSDYFDYLYKFDGVKYLDDLGELVTNPALTSPQMYLYNLIFPTLNLIRQYNLQK